jgi:hypothetical protein
MSTPFVAGAAALILESLGTTPDVARTIQRILQTTAASVASSHTDGAPLQTVAQQGAGLIQVDRAINMKTTVSPGQIALNDTEHFKAKYIVRFSLSAGLAEQSLSQPHHLYNEFGAEGGHVSDPPRPGGYGGHPYTCTLFLWDATVL